MNGSAPVGDGSSRSRQASETSSHLPSSSHASLVQSRNDRPLSTASVSSARTISQNTISSRADSRGAHLMPSASPTSTRATGRRCSTEREWRPSKQLTLSEELGQDRPDSWDQVDGAKPRNSLVSIDSRSTSPKSNKKSVAGRPSSRLKKRDSGAMSATTLFIAMAPETPSSLLEDDQGPDHLAEGSQEEVEVRQASISTSPPDPRSCETNTNMSRSFFRLPNGLKLVAQQFFADLVQALLLIFFEMLRPLSPVRTSGSSQAANQHGTQDAPASLRAALQEYKATPNKLFAEKFRYAICTSFLLTPTLSISLYDSPQDEAGVPLTGGEAEKEDFMMMARCLPSAGVTGTKSIAVEAMRFSIYFKSQTVSRTSRDILLPLRDAAIVASLLLWPVSPSNSAWARALLLLTTISWSTSLLCDHLTNSGDATLSFMVTHHGGILPPAALRSAIEQRQLCADLLTTAALMLRINRESDVQINKVITAIQEVELVARGFKITHPMPPISRIEAASSNDIHVSPARRRGSLFNGSGGPLGRPVGNYSNSANGYDRAPIQLRRMSNLRRGLLQAYSDASQACRVLIDELQPLVEAEELSSLHEVYSLKEPSSASLPGQRPSSPSQSGAQYQHGRHGSLLLPLLTSNGVSSLDSPSVATTPNGYKRSSCGSRLGFASPLPGAGGDSFDDSLTSKDSPQSAGVMRYSLASETSSTGLSRSGSLLRRARERDANAEGGSPGDSGNDALPPGFVPEGRSGRGSRLSYIVEGPSSPWPNSSAAAKRLSYQSSDSRPESQRSSSARSDRRDSIEATVKILASPKTASLGNGGSWQSPTNYQTTLRRNGSLFGGHVSPAGIHTNPLSNVGDAYLRLQQRQEPEVDDRLSLLSLRQAFEEMHSLRRHALCHLLALKFITLPPASFRDYWQNVETSISKFTDAFDGLKTRIAAFLEQEVNGAPYSSVRTHENRSTPGISTLPGSTGLVPFTGFEDRAEALALAIRSVQVKLRACAGELEMAHPPALHGADIGEEGQQAPTRATQSAPEILARKESAERIWESLNDDIVSITQEWESGLKILRAEKRRENIVAMASSSGTDTTSGLDGTACEARDHITEDVSLLREDDEDASAFEEAQRAFLASHLGSKVVASHLQSPMEPSYNTDPSTSQSEEGQLDSIFRFSTSPDHLPPPGLEEVFESIAGIAGSLDGHRFDVSGRRMTREERIRRVKEQREQSQRQDAGIEADGGGGGNGLGAQAGVVTELKDVLGQLRQKREATATAAAASVVAASQQQEASHLPEEQGDSL